MLRKFEKRPMGSVKILPLIDYLTEQNQLLDAMGKILFKEHCALKDRNADLIDACSKEKAALLSKLSGNDQKIRLHPDSARLKSDYARHVEVLRLKLSECKRRNEVNGKLISFCMTSNRRLSDLLMRSRDRFTRNLTYTGEGRTVARGPSRLSVEA